MEFMICQNHVPKHTHAPHYQYLQYREKYHLIEKGNNDNIIL